MADTPNKEDELLPADVKVRAMLNKINRLTDYRYTPKNIVVVTIEDVIEITREIVPYTMSKLDEVHSETALQQSRDQRIALEARIDERKAMGARLNKAIFFSSANPDGQFVKDCIIAELNSAEEEHLATLKQSQKEE